MKLCTFLPCELPADARSARLGAVSIRDPEQVIDLAAAWQALYGGSGPTAGAEPPGAPRSGLPCWLQSMQAWLEGGPEARQALATLLQECDPLEGPFRRPLEHITLLAPLPRPASIRDCMAFERHYLQAMRGGARFKFPAAAALDAWTRRMFGFPLIRVPALFRELPAYYKGNPASVVGHEAEVRWPAYSEKLDYELEVGLFIHKEGRDLTPAQALELVAGYTLFNDFSARDAQLREMDLRLGPAKGKDFDTGNAMGPYLVTPDELPDLSSLSAVARVNGEVWTESSLRELQFPVGEILSYISRSETLYPGDFIGLGTVPDGCGLEHGRWLKPGDVVELEVTGLGRLRNRVVKG